MSPPVELVSRGRRCSCAVLRQNIHGLLLLAFSMLASWLVLLLLLLLLSCRRPCLQLTLVLGLAGSRGAPSCWRGRGRQQHLF